MIGYHLVTELGVFDTCIESLKECIDNPLPVLIKTRLKEADSSIVYRVHYRNASKFLKELKEVRD